MTTSFATPRGDAATTGPLHRLQRPRGRRSLWAEELVRTLAGASAMAVLAVLGLMVFDTASTARPVFAAHLGDLVAGHDWQPAAGSFGALPFAYGTLVTSAVAMLLAVP